MTRARNGIAHGTSRCLALWGGLVAWCAAGCGQPPLPPPPSQSHETTPQTTVPVRPVAVVPRAKTDNPPPKIADSVVLKPIADPPAPAPRAIQAEKLTPIKGPGDVGQIITALAPDHQGNVWIGTQERGVVRHSPKDEWTRFTARNGLGDDYVYAICEDRLGRIWIGHRNHGVSVFNGETWKNYDVLSGPLGERVFDIQCSPVDGDVWIATCLGLARYSETNRRWSYFTRADGLPSDQTNSLAFDPQGALYVGMQCDGLAVGESKDDFRSWRVISGELSAEKYRDPFGNGLPGSQVNDVLVHSSGVIYVATTLGLGKSADGGASWKFLRGRDYVDKVRGRTQKPPANWKPLSAEQQAAQLLPEDHVTCLAEDDRGLLWVGFRTQGWLILDPKTGEMQAEPQPLEKVEDEDFKSLLPMEDGRAWLGSYGHGLSRQAEPPKIVAAKPRKELATAAITTTRAVHPQPAAPPTVAELAAFQSRIERAKEPLPELWGTFLNDDWATEGDWVGRMGRHDTRLCAAGAPLDHSLGTVTRYIVSGAIGPHATKDDGLRHWLHWLKTDQRRVLYNPTVGSRREAEWDDHGEVYPFAHEGPDVWIMLDVPEGLHRVSLYFVNPNGDRGKERFRDYLIELKPYYEGKIASADRGRTLPRTRVCDFWGGVYKQFLVKGPNKYWIKIGRNDSFNTIVSGVFLDMVDRPWPHEHLHEIWLGSLPYGPVPMPDDFDDLSPELPKIVAFKAAADRGWQSPRTAAWQRTAHLLAYRAVLVDDTAQPNLLANWRWNLRVWSAKDREKFDEKMKTAWFIMCRKFPDLEEFNKP